MCDVYLERQLHRVPRGALRGTQWCCKVFWRRISLSKRGQPGEAVGACKGLPRFQGLVAAVSQKAMTWMPEPVKWIRDLLTDQSDEP